MSTTPGSTADDPIADIWDDWNDAVNLPRAELQKWLDTDESKSVGDTGGADSTGRKSGHRIVAIPEKKKADLTESDADWMRKVVGYVHRHLAQRPDGDVTDTNWRYSLMNWGHDPLKK